MGKDLDDLESFPTTISVSYLDVLGSDDEEDIFSIDTLGFEGLSKNLLELWRDCVLRSFLDMDVLGDLISYLLYYHLTSFLITWIHTNFCLLLFLARPGLDFANLNDLFDKNRLFFRTK